MPLNFGVDLQAFLGRKSTRVFITICMIICYGNRRGTVPHCFCRRLRSYVLTCPQRFNSPGRGVAAGGSLRSSLSGSRPTSHSQGHGRPCLPRPHLRRDFLKQRNLTDVSSRNLVQFGFSVVLHLDIFLVIGIIELVQHILTYVEIDALSSQLLPEFGRFSSLRVRGCGPPLI